MNVAEIESRFQRLMPPGHKFRASIPFVGFAREDGSWWEPADDDLFLRVTTPTCYVDSMAKEEDLALTDEQFQERILRPMLDTLERFQRSPSFPSVPPEHQSDAHS